MSPRDIRQALQQYLCGALLLHPHIGRVTAVPVQAFVFG